MLRLWRSALLLLVTASSIPSPVVARQLTSDWIQVAYERRVQDEPSNPELFFEIAARYWDAAYRDKTLAVSQKREFIVRGLVSVDRALTLKPDYREALICKNLLLRLQATVETDPDRQQALIRQADELREKADLLAPLPR
jgi:hypothetical protein